MQIHERTLQRARIAADRNGVAPEPRTLCAGFARRIAIQRLCSFSMPDASILRRDDLRSGRSHRALSALITNEKRPCRCLILDDTPVPLLRGASPCATHSSYSSMILSSNQPVKGALSAFPMGGVEAFPSIAAMPSWAADAAVTRVLVAMSAARR